MEWPHKEHECRNHNPCRECGVPIGDLDLYGQGICDSCGYEGPPGPCEGNLVRVPE